jgi:proteasome lid subunit RPN8/RPN11
VLLLSKKVLETMVCHCLDGYPLEACGLLRGIPDGPVNARATAAVPTENVAGSARVYEVDPRALLRADREAETRGEQLIGVYHSHTHTDAMPSATDIGQAPDPDWHYVLVSLRDVHPGLRSWRIREGTIEEEQVVLEW